MRSSVRASSGCTRSLAGFVELAVAAGRCGSIPESSLSAARRLRSDCASAYETGKPFAASSTAGCTSSAHGFLPYFFEAYSRPRTVPGTPEAR